jgi:hypothetical protein
MKFFLSIYDNYLVKPSTAFYLNIFFLKNNNYFNFKTLKHIHIFLQLRKVLQIKIFKFNYLLSNNFFFFIYLIIGLLNIILLYILI